MVLPSQLYPVQQWFGRLAPEGTTVGDQIRDQFYANLLAILGDTPLLWLPESSDTTTATSKDRNGRSITWDATVASRFSRLGSGLQQDFDGDDDEGDTPDVAAYSFGDGTNDTPFSLLWVGTPDTDASAQTLISKQNSATVDEWELHITATNGYPTFDLIDASSSGIIGRSHDTDIGTSLVFIAATYSGSQAVGGMNIYKNAAVVDDGTGGTTGSYTAMEDTASLVRLGCRYTTQERFYNGNKALTAIVAKELTPDELWAIKEMLNGLLDASL